MGACLRRAAPAVPLLRAQNNARAAARARRFWRMAVRRITHILRIRYRWGLLGQALQEPRLQALVEGLERRRGVVVRVLPKAKARVFRR